MALQFISSNATPTYIALSTDIVGGKITGASLVGGTVLTTDDGGWYIIKKDLSLSTYALPVGLNGTISIGSVNQGTAGIEAWLVELASKYAELQVGLTKYAQVSSDEFHFRVHDGTLWAMSYIESGLAQSATSTIGITTGVKKVHCGISFFSSGEARIDFYANAVFTGGTPTLIINHDCEISDTPVTQIVSNPTVSNNGTLKRSLFIGGGSGGNRSGGSNPFSNEFIIPANSQFRIVYTNLDGSNAIFNVLNDFYEV